MSSSDATNDTLRVEIIPRPSIRPTSPSDVMIYALVADGENPDRAS